MIQPLQPYPPLSQFSKLEGLNFLRQHFSAWRRAGRVLQGFRRDQLKRAVSLTVLTYRVLKGSTSYRLFPYSFQSLNRDGELLLVMKTRVTKADVLLGASEVSGLFLDFPGQMHGMKCPGAAWFCLRVPAPFVQSSQWLPTPPSAEDTQKLCQIPQSPLWGSACAAIPPCSLWQVNATSLSSG